MGSWEGAFATSGICLECALEIEENSEMEHVIKLRSPETMEWIEEIVKVGLEWERVTEGWGL